MISFRLIRSSGARAVLTRLFPHYRASISSIVIVVYGPNRVRDITENVRGEVHLKRGREGGRGRGHDTSAARICRSSLWAVGYITRESSRRRRL